MNPENAKVLKIVSDILEKAADNYVGEMADKATIAKFEHEVTQCLRKVAAENWLDSNQIQFKPCVYQDNNCLNLEPENFYTAALMFACQHGLAIPTRIFGNEYFWKNFGTLYVENGKYFFRPIKPDEHIDIAFTIGPNGVVPNT